MLDQHFVSVVLARELMEETLEGSRPGTASGRDTQEILLGAAAPRRGGWLEFLLRRWTVRHPVAKTQAEC
ncbi:hypothetical protein [Calidithermus chliarophilus]|uniref:hypothetical protein n=1 Tax=Calidithermus chliarophilus TaxID=52023 RepID=UPI0003F9812A|nr:hypothetical protein [Calidithermus chliarophilus]